MKKTKKIIALVLAAVMLVCTTVAATVAYLTANADVVTNTFTVGKVTIDLDEVQVDPYGIPSTFVEEGGVKVWTPSDEAPRINANEYKLIPGHSYTKDPVVTVEKESEVCWVFVKVVNELETIIADTTIEAQIAGRGWVALDGETDVYYYYAPVDAREAAVELPVFESFTLKTDAEVAGYADSKITIDAYAVQADGFETAAAAWTAAKGTWDN